MAAENAQFQRQARAPQSRYAFNKPFISPVSEVTKLESNPSCAQGLKLWFNSARDFTRKFLCFEWEVLTKRCTF